MQSKKTVLLAALFFVLTSPSCSLFATEGPTPEPDPSLYAPAQDPLKFEPESLPIAQVGVAYEAEIHITQNRTPAGDFSISEGILPPGLELTKIEGEDTVKISGVPKEAGNFNFTVSVWCYGTMVFGQLDEIKYSIVVKK